MQEDKRLKLFLVLQSFCPLFIMIFIQHVGHWSLVWCFISGLLHGDFGVLRKALINPAFGDVFIMTTCILWFILTAIVAVGFNDFQKYGFDSYGEHIVVGTEKKDSGITFLVSFILPLLVDDVSTIRGLLFFSTLLFMVVFLLMRSDLFYENPVLVALQYKTFEFRFIEPYRDVVENKTYIGLTKGNTHYGAEIIKRRYIADGVFLIYNDFDLGRKDA